MIMNDYFGKSHFVDPFSHIYIYIYEEFYPRKRCLNRVEVEQGH